MAVCKSCSAAIIWARSANGRAMPLDAKPTPTGRFYLERGQALDAASAPANANRFETHFVTCPNAIAHRKRGKR